MLFGDPSILALLLLAGLFPADAGVIDVTKPPYAAKGDGKADDTAAIQKALDDHPNTGAIIYLPRGRYLIRDTLTWPKGSRGGLEWKNTILQGEGRGLSVLALPDDCPGFGDPAKPKAMLWTGRKPAQRFRNAVRSLTLDAGSNKGAIGAQFNASNQGTFRDVLVKGVGPIGLDLAFTDEVGPLLVKSVRVEGFGVGIKTGFAVNSATFEDIDLVDQAEAAFANNGQVVSIRRLRAKGAPVVNGKAPSLMVLLDSVLEGGKGAAVANEGCLLVRDLATKGYEHAVSSGGKTVPGGKVEEWLSHAPALLGSKKAATLRLPVKETPDVPWDKPADWVGPFQHGFVAAKGKLPADATKAVQAAIDSGKTTVYLPRGVWRFTDTLVLRKNVRRFIGCEARLVVDKAFAESGKPLFRVEEGEGPVIIERLQASYGPAPAVYVEQACKRAVVLRHLICYGERAYRNTGGGPLFLEDVCGGRMEFGKHDVWARQLNVENQGTHVMNDGGRFWVLGYKTERGGTLVHTKGGGASEVLGCFAYSTSGPKLEPMLVNEGSSVSATLREACFNRNPFQTIIEETRDGTTRKLGLRDVPRWTNGALLALYCGAP